MEQYYINYFSFSDLYVVKEIGNDWVIAEFKTKREAQHYINELEKN